MNMMKSAALAAVMIIAGQASAANKVNADKADLNHGYSIQLPVAQSQSKVQRIDRAAVNGHGHQTVIHNHQTASSQPKSCQCGECRKIQKKLDKHFKKNHKGKQNRMTCRTCMKYSQQLAAVHAHDNMQGMGHCLHNRR